MQRPSEGGGACLWVALLLLLAAPAAAQQPPYTITVYNSQNLAAALRNASALAQQNTTNQAVILLALDYGPGGAGSYFALDRNDWVGAGAIPILSGQHVRITSAGGSAEPITLDFAGMSSVIVQHDGSELEWDNVVLRGFASKHLVNVSQYPYYRVHQLGGWPSYTAYPGAQIKWTNVSGYFLSDDCSVWGRNLAASNVSIYAAAGATLINSVTLSLAGPTTVNLRVANASTEATVGYVQFSYQGSTGYCVQDQNAPLGGVYVPPAAPPVGAAGASAGGGHIKWWIALIIGLAGGGLLLGGVAALLIWYGMRWKHSKEAAAFQQASKTPVVDWLQSQGTVTPGNSNNEGGALGPLKGLEGGLQLPDHWKQRWLGPLEDEQVEVGPLLGRGGYGRVYKGRWKSAIVAIKIVEHSHFPKGSGNRSNSPSANVNSGDSASNDARVARELLLSTSISHPNVIATYKICTIRVGDVPDAGDLSGDSAMEGATMKEVVLSPAAPKSAAAASQDGASSASGEKGALLETWLLMEYADRGSLSDALRAGRFPTHDYTAIYRCLLDIASGVDYLHTSGLIHGDLKSANVLLRSTGTDARGFTCKLADFGLTRVLDVDKRTHISTQTYGTVAYMPPELLSHSRLTRSADVYSFGMMMWELFTGETPFDNMTMGQIFFTVVQEKARPPVPEGMRAGYAALMQQCWAEDAAERPTIAAVMKQLQVLYKEHRASGMNKANSSPA